MDLLYHRYADPLPLLDTVIGFGQLEEFIYTMMGQIDEDRLWELYLHQLIKEQSFEGWKASLVENTRERNDKDSGAVPVTQDDINAAVQRSQNILNSFVPD